MDPLVFTPYLRSQVWGSRRLVDDLGKSAATDEPLGESWEVSAHPHHPSVVAEGPHAGATLADLWRDHGAELWGPRQRPDAFPLLVKLLDCRDRLSVQVHPCDLLAPRFSGEARGKTEAWVVLAAEPGATIYAGLVPGTTPKSLAAAVSDGTVEQCLASFHPQPGDCVYLPSGTVHAVGGGVLFAEVQQSSDATLRLYDWDRQDSSGQRRKLHVREALESITWPGEPVTPLRNGRATEVAVGVHKEELVASPYFRLSRWSLSTAMPQPFAGELTIWLVLNGRACLRSSTGEYDRRFATGSSVLLPASSPPLEWSTAEPGRETTLLAVQLPRD